MENDAVCVLSACFAGSSSHPALKDEVARIYAEELGVTSYGAEYSVLVGPPIKYDETQGFMGVKDWNNIFSYFTDFSNTLKYNLYKMGLKKDLSGLSNFKPLKRFDPPKKEDNAQSPE